MQLYSSEVLEYMNRLSASLKETYANTVHEDDYIPVKGEVCVAKYTVDQVTSVAMNYLIRCFTFLQSCQLDTGAFNDAGDGLKARLGRLCFSSSGSIPGSVGLLPPWARSLRPALFRGCSRAGCRWIASLRACAYSCS